MLCSRIGLGGENPGEGADVEGGCAISLTLNFSGELKLQLEMYDQVLQCVGGMSCDPNLLFEEALPLSRRALPS